MNKKIYGAYIRVSTDGQVEDGDSIEMQKNLAKEHVEKEGGILYKFYIEEGVSATKTKLTDRKKLMECLGDIEKGLFNNLIAYKRDRLSRSPEDTLAIRTKLEQFKCPIYFTATGEQQMVLNDPYNKMMEGIYSSLAEIESYQTAIRVSDTMFNNAKKGQFSGGNVTYGYINDNGFLRPVKEQIPIIEEVVDMYLKGYGVHSIVLWLEGKPVRNKGTRYAKAKKMKQHKRSTSKWTKDNVTAILFNPTYSGYMQYTKRINDINETIVVKSKYIEPIRSEEKQNKINAEREKRNKSIQPPRKYNTSFLLTGILVCAECGREYASRTVTKGNGHRYSYYICKGRHAHTSDICDSKTFKKEILEEFILEEAKRYVKQFVDSDVHLRVKKEIEKKDVKLTQQLEDITDEIAKKQKNFGAMSNLILDLDTEDETYEMMKNMYQKQQKEILLQLNNLKESKLKIEEELKIQSVEETNLDDIIEQLKDFNEIIEFAPLHLQKKLLDSLFSKIEINKKGDTTFYLTFEVDRINATVDFASIGTAHKTEENSVMFLGGIGDTTTPKNITVLLNEKTYSINYFKWLNTTVEYISNDFFDFILSKNNKLNNIDYFCNVTGLSSYMLSEYKTYKRLPSYSTFNKLLTSANCTIQDYIDRIKSHTIICNKNIIEQILNDSNTIRRNAMRYSVDYNKERC